MNKNADFTHDENIMTVLKTLGANSEQTAVSSEEIESSCQKSEL